MNNGPYLTTNHPTSSYGQPVLVMDGVAYGPMDYLPREGAWQAGEWVNQHLLEFGIPAQQQRLASQFIDLWHPRSPTR